MRENSSSPASGATGTAVQTERPETLTEARSFERRLDTLQAFFRPPHPFIGAAVRIYLPADTTSSVGGERQQWALARVIGINYAAPFQCQQPLLELEVVEINSTVRRHNAVHGDQPGNWDWLDPSADVRRCQQILHPERYPDPAAS